MKRKNKLLLFLTAICLFLCCFAFASCDDDFQIGDDIGSHSVDFYYTLLSDNTYEISGGKAKRWSSLKIPEYHDDGHKITRIGDFSEGKMKTVELPQSITAIGTKAFYNCEELKQINIPEGVTTLKLFTFGSCYKLQTISLPETLTRIEDWVFNGCRSLQSIEIPDAVEYIGKNTFLLNNENFTYTTDTYFKYVGTKSNPYFYLVESKEDNVSNPIINENCKIINNLCYGMKTITIPESVTHIVGSFNSQKTLQSVDIRAPLTTIEADTFYKYEKLTTVSLPSTITRIGDSAFRCTNLSAIVIPESVTKIEASAFDNCKNLRSVTLPPNLVSIGSSAFSNCENLSSPLTFPQSLTEIGNSAFYSCYSLPRISFENLDVQLGASAFSSCRSLQNFTLPNSLSKNVFKGCESLTSVVIPEGITVIPEDAFWYCHNLTSVTLPQSLVTIESTAFSQCLRLPEIVIPESVLGIQDGAFSSCENLRRITLPTKLHTLGNSVFSKCFRLTDVSIPENVISLGHDIFLECNSLPTVTENGLTYRGDNNNPYFSLIASDENIEKFTTNERCKTVDWRAFYGRENLKSARILDGVRAVGGAFINCPNLTEVYLSKSVETIYAYFENCQALKHVFYGGEEGELAITCADKYKDWTKLLYYYSEEEPEKNAEQTAYVGNYWHYVAGKPTPWAI